MALSLISEAIKPLDMNQNDEFIISSFRKHENIREIQNLSGRTIYYFNHLKFCGINDNYNRKKKEEK